MQKHLDFASHMSHSKLTSWFRPFTLNTLNLELQKRDHSICNFCALKAVAALFVCAVSSGLWLRTMGDQSEFQWVVLLECKVHGLRLRV